MADLASVIASAVGAGILTGIIAIVGQVIQAGKTKVALDEKEKADALAKVAADKVMEDRHNESKHRFEKLETALSMGNEGLFITRREAQLKDDATAAELKRMNLQLATIEQDVDTLVRRTPSRPARSRR